MRRDKDYDQDRGREDPPTDRMLRDGGFKIKDRPPDGEPIWIRKGRIYTETQAWRLLNAEKIGKRRGYQV